MSSGSEVLAVTEMQTKTQIMHFGIYFYAVTNNDVDIVLFYITNKSDTIISLNEDYIVFIFGGSLSTSAINCFQSLFCSIEGCVSLSLSISCISLLTDDIRRSSEKDEKE